MDKTGEPEKYKSATAIQFMFGVFNLFFYT